MVIVYVCDAFVVKRGSNKPAYCLQALTLTFLSNSSARQVGMTGRSQRRKPHGSAAIFPEVITSRKLYQGMVCLLPTWCFGGLSGTLLKKYHKSARDGCVGVR